MGSLHVVRIGRDIDPVNAVYRIAFAPLDGSLQSRQAQREGLDSLTDFLRQTGVPIPEIERTWVRGRVQTVGHAGRRGRVLAQVGAAGVRELRGGTSPLPRLYYYAVVSYCAFRPRTRGGKPRSTSSLLVSSSIPVSFVLPRISRSRSP
jgi:hypothetical protein